jgi:predicted nucleotidyltransferase
MWKLAGIVTHVIKRFPFVRGVFVTGSLSKNSSDSSSDLDFMVITRKGRLWIARTLLMLFKKIFLLNSYKYFCINFLLSEDNLEIEDKNVFTATEVMTVKAT